MFSYKIFKQIKNKITYSANLNVYQLFRFVFVCEDKRFINCRIGNS